MSERAERRVRGDAGDVLSTSPARPPTLSGEERRGSVVTASDASSGGTALLEITALTVRFGRANTQRGRGSGHLAVDGVSFAVNRGQTLGLIGESGSGKTTVCKVMAGLVEPTAGEALLDGQRLFPRSRTSRAARRRVQMVFQDPFASLDPGLRVADIVREPLRVHRIGSTGEQRDRVKELLELVGLDRGYLTRYPHQMSGGQLQRVAVARALALEPDLLLADEPLSALDVSIQAQVSNLLMRLQRDLGISILFVGHDLAAVRRLSDQVAVMFNGRIMEMGPADEVYGAPKHPYTLSLMSAAPQPSTKANSVSLTAQRREASADGDGGGCTHRVKCWLYENLGRPSRCQSEVPEIDSKREYVGSACHFSTELTHQPEYGRVLSNAQLA